MRWQQFDNGRVVHQYEWLILVATLAFVPVIVVQADVKSPGWQRAADVLNWAIWGVFVLELVLVLWIAPRRKQALRAHWLDIGLVVVTAPMYGWALSSLRLLRLVRLLRLLRLGFLLGRALQSERLMSNRQVFRLVGLITVLVVVIAGAVEATVDQGDFHSVWDGIWWAVVTVTTVGYGDITPHSVTGRIVAIVVMFVGIGFISVLTATVASHFIRTDAAPQDRADADRDAAIALRLDQVVIDLSTDIRAVNDRLARIEQALSREA